MHPGSTPPNPSAPSRLQERAAVLDDLGEVVLNDDQNLIISSQDHEAMMQAARSLQAFWRTRAPDVVVEQFTGDQRLALLSHINQGIAKLGLYQAMQKPHPPYYPKQIAIITHAELLPASDVHMLQDLTRHLPGLCWRWVLLRMDKPGGQDNAAHDNVNAVGPRAAWLAEPAPAAPATTAIPTAPVVPGELVEPFFEPTAPLASVEVVAHGEPSVSAETAALAELPLLPTPLQTPQAVTKVAVGRPLNRWAWLGFTALLVLGVSGAWLQFGADPSGPSLTAERPAPVASALTTALDTAVAPASDPVAETPTLPSSSAAQPNDPAAASTAPGQAEESAPLAAAAPTAARLPATTPADTSAELPDVALRGVRWLAQQSPEFYVLEHGVFQTAAHAQSLIKTRAELANARVIMRKNAAPGGRFLVITGPFRSQDRAQNYKVRENLSPQIPVRRVSDVLEESMRAAPSRP